MSDTVAPPPAPEVRVLMVDDELGIRSALARSLNLLGYRTDEADSGYQALRMLGCAPYDVMVLDIRMPGMSGVEVMRRVHQMYLDLPIIVLTGHGTLDSAIAAVRAGAVDYLLKPVSVYDLAAAITSALRRRPQQEPPQAPTSRRFLRVGPLTLDRERRLATTACPDNTGGPNVRLTAIQAALLAHLMQHPNTSFSCRELAQTPLGYTMNEKDARTIIQPHMSRLRRRIELELALPRLIHTVPGKGYCFVL